MGVLMSTCDGYLSSLGSCAGGLRERCFYFNFSINLESSCSLLSGVSIKGYFLEIWLYSSFWVDRVARSIKLFSDFGTGGIVDAFAVKFRYPSDVGVIL